MVCDSERQETISIAGKTTSMNAHDYVDNGLRKYIHIMTEALTLSLSFSLNITRRPAYRQLLAVPLEPSAFERARATYVEPRTKHWFIYAG